MKMQFKKEVKHSVVYETEDPKAPMRSIYVAKSWIIATGGFVGGGWPKTLDVEVKVL